MNGRGGALVVVAIVAVGSLAYALLGTTTKVDGNRMARLVIPTTGIAKFKSHPVTSTFEPPSKSTSSLVKRAAASHPTETGIYQVAWKGSSTTSEVGMMVELLPTTTLARSVLNGLVSDYSEPKKLSAESLTLAHKF